MPRLLQLAHAGWSAPLKEAIPAVTCANQATMLTGKLPQEHGIVGNGWLFRETSEVRFWQQSYHQIQQPTLLDRLRSWNPDFRVANLFWWFNEGCPAAFRVTPKPWYGVNGDKRFDIHAEPPELKSELLGKLRSFPFPAFWGPTAGAGSTAWISAAAAQVVREQQPDLTFVYLPHIDYEPQRHGPSGCEMATILGEVDSFAGGVIDAADRIGASIFVVNEYVHCDVTRPVYLNMALREAGFLRVRSGPFGELIDVYASAAFAACDHQLAHVYTRPGCDHTRLDQLLRNLPGVADIAAGPDRQRLGLDHPRAGDWVLMSEPDAWFAYPYWLDQQRAPDFARAVAIHQKPGYDP
ncbi:MAG: alkaline phosphatase family protein, partial [Gemmataceae bacterium]